MGLELRDYFACRFVLEAKGLSHVENGMTNNSAETLNSQLTFLKDINITMSDALILEMNRFKNLLNNEALLAYYGVGRYELSEDHWHLPFTYLDQPGDAFKDVMVMVMRQTSHVEGTPPASVHERGVSQSRPPSSVQEHAKHCVEKLTNFGRSLSVST